MRLKLKIKLITLLVSFLMIGAAAISSTVAFLYVYDDPVVNKFIPSKVTTAVVEDIETNPGVKSDVKIANTGDTTAWIRAAVVVTWQDAAGNVYGQMPANTDYTISFNLDEQTDPAGQWIEAGDGFYYWSQPVPVAGNTGVLIANCTPIKKSITVSTGSSQVTYYLTVEILGSGIQTFQGITAWNAAWDKATKSEAVTTE